MPTPPPFPSIPTPTAEPAALLQTCIALKQAVEMLTGQDADQSKYAPHVFVQTDTPTALHIGDLWLCTAKTYTFNVWDGQHWLKLGSPISPLEAQATFDFAQFMKASRR